MRASEFVSEAVKGEITQLPDMVYHGTKRGNLPSITRSGLRPRLNKWMWNNSWHNQAPGRPGYSAPSAEQKAQDTVVSTVGDLESALAYAKLGGSTGWGGDTGLVLAFKPLPTDKFVFGGYDGGEIVFYNVISPDRLKIVYPENLAGKEQQYVQRGQDVTEFTKEKFKKIADINKQLRKVGSQFKVHSYRYTSINPAIFITKTTDGVHSVIDINGNKDYFAKKETTLDSEDFKQWLAQQLNKSNQQGVAEDRENFNGINLLLQKDDEELFVKASAGSRELGHVLFVIDGDYLMPQDLEVDERFRGQGIAQTMYDYVKSKGYKIRRSGQQTDAGAGFWNKHRAAQNVWEQDDSEGKSHDFMAGHCHVMALALKQLHPDWQIRAHVGWDDDAADDTEYRVDHVYTVAPDGTAYDCRGKFDNEQQLVGPDATGGVDTQYVNFGPEEIKQAMLRGELKRFTKQDLDNAMQTATQVGKD